MWGSAALEVVVGVVFLFILVSTVCVAVREGLEAWLKTRAAYLERGIRELLHDREAQGLARQLFEHPLIHGLYLGPYRPGPVKLSVFARGDSLPSYIPSRSFVLALLDLAARGPEEQRANQPVSLSMTLTDVQQTLSNIDNPAIRRVLSMAFESARGDLEKAIAFLESWFDSGMDRVSGWYKRSSQWITLAIALFIAGALNIDAIAIAEFLYRNDVARSAIVAQAEAQLESGAPPSSTAGVWSQVDRLSLPIGWGPRPELASGRALEASTIAQAMAHARHVLGILLTVIAAMLGAPFWFDVLSKVMAVRGAVKPRDKSRVEGSDARPTQLTWAPMVMAEPRPRAAELTHAHEPNEDGDACGLSLGMMPTRDDELPMASGGVH